MDTRFLSSLLAVVDRGSIAEAARAQQITPAAVSQRIKTLEHQLGCQLLSRLGHSAKPTSACLNMLPRVRRLMTETEALKSDVSDQRLVGQLRVGAISTALTGIMPDVIKNLSKKAPSITLHIQPGTSEEIFNKLTKQELDVAILVEPPFVPPKYLIVQPLYVEPLSLIVSSTNHALTQTKGEVLIKELLLSQPFIRYDRSAWGGMIAHQYLLEQNIGVDSLCEMDSLESIAILVKKAVGVSLVPLWNGLKEQTRGLTIMPIEDAKYSRRLVLISHRQVGKEPLICALSNELSRIICV